MRKNTVVAILVSIFIHLLFLFTLIQKNFWKLNKSHDRGIIAIDYAYIENHQSNKPKPHWQPKSPSTARPFKDDIKASDPDPTTPSPPQTESRSDLDSSSSETKTNSTENHEGPSTSAQKISATEKFISQVLELLEKSKIYPQESIDREEEGTVLLSVTLNQNGEILEIEVESTSRFKRLDEAAIASIHNVKQMPSPPPILEAPIHLHIPIVFQIKKN